MNKENIIAFIEDKKEMNSVSLNELKTFLLKYPFCQTARILFLKNIQKIDTQQFQREFPISRLFIGDINKLYLHLNENTIISQEKEIIKNTSINNEEVNNEDILKFDEHSDNQAIEINIDKDKILAEAKNPDLLDLDEENQKSNLQNSLIDNFIQAHPKIVPNDSKEANKDISLDSIIETEAIYTEKLAQIYVSQKNYIKAIEVYNKLSLNIPKKSTYFAEQIKKLKEILN